jgi:phenylalanyl-tRNA synthetase beta chain
MKVSLSWLKAYVAVEMAVDALAEALTMAGLEVEAVSDRYSRLETVLVGRVLAVAPHPRADHLQCCRVEIGGRNVAVVCGAPNVAPDQLAPLALPGTELPGGVRLQKGIIRGEVSEGMLCSQAELGLGDEAGGIMVLPPGTAQPGTPLNRALNLCDPVLEIGLTPNRPDCLSIIGVAREVAAIQKTPLRLPEPSTPSPGSAISQQAAVAIQAPEHCSRYAARLLQGVSVGPSPYWLQDRLLSVGLKPINNVVDITNFVMMETGQPLHAFDFDRLAEHRIVVRTAAAGERFTTLDGKARELTPEMLLICDGQKPVAIAGVMGGLNSEISADSRSVLIESAHFDPISIRKTAKALGLNTDAAHRFERGVDPEGTLIALNRAADLMQQLTGGAAVSGLIDVHPRRITAPRIALSVAATNRLLGLELNAEQITAFLTAIAFTVNPGDADRLEVTPPSFRVDVSRPEDLMEEVARLSGYNQIPTTFPLIPAKGRTVSRYIETRERVRDNLVGAGFCEAISYTFIHAASCDRLNLAADDPRRCQVQILNPITEDQTTMRSSLLPGLLEALQRNTAQQVKTLRFFEVGKIFIKETAGAELPVETEMLAVLWSGLRSEEGWFAKPEGCDFYDIKGVAERLLQALRVAPVRFSRLTPEDCRYVRPGAAAQIFAGPQAIGTIGEVHPRVLLNYDLKQPAFFFEIDIDRLFPLVPEVRRASAPPKFPFVERDLTVILDTAIEAGEILGALAESGQKLVESLRLLDVYTGPPIPQDKKSVSVRITYRSDTGTLEDAVVSRVHRQLSDGVVARFGATLPA